jgi:hypothetical protein
MDKKEQLQKRNNFIFLLVGIVLVISLLLIYREGLTWFSATKWTQLSAINWISIVVIFGLSLVIQYYFFMLLRFSVLKYLVFWLIPVIWLFNNGLVTLHRLFNLTADIVTPAGWITLGELFSWLLSAIYFPLLIAGGVVVAIVDSSGSMLTQACYYAGMAMDVAGVSVWNIVSYSMNFLSVIWDLLSDSFVQQVMHERSMNQPFLDFSLSSTFGLPYWILSIGYSFTCILI